MRLPDDMLIIVSLALVAFACLITLSVAYLILLAGAYYFVLDKQVPRVLPKKRFSILIPAHNEELIITASLQSWLKVDYPKEKFHLHVIADNCTDRTIEVAQSLEATVWDRQDYENIGGEVHDATQ